MYTYTPPGINRPKLAEPNGPKKFGFRLSFGSVRKFSLVRQLKKVLVFDFVRFGNRLVQFSKKLITNSTNLNRDFKPK